MKFLQFFKSFTVAALLCASIAPMAVSAQENEEPTPNYPLIFKTSDAVANNPLLKALIYDLQPTIFINGPADRFLYGNAGFRAVECSPSQFAQLYVADPLFVSVELIRIKLKSPADAEILDFDQLQSFTKLTYILFLYEYEVCGNEEITDCIPMDVDGKITAANPNFIVLYELSVAGDQ